MNITEQQLINPLCENIDEKENHEEDKLKSEEDITQHARESEIYDKGERITYDKNKNSMIEKNKLKWWRKINWQYRSFKIWINVFPEW